MEDWESDQLPEEEIQSILIGFAGFTDSILTHASLVGLSAESRDRMTALFAEILCQSATCFPLSVRTVTQGRLIGPLKGPTKGNYLRMFLYFSGNSLIECIFINIFCYSLHQTRMGSHLDMSVC